MMLFDSCKRPTVKRIILVLRLFLHDDDFIIKNYNSDDIIIKYYFVILIFKQ